MKKPVLCCSYPKCGRTWLRFILANYFNLLNKYTDHIDYNNVFTLFPNSGRNPLKGIPAYKYMDDERLPLVLFDHNEYYPDFDNVDVIFLIRGIYDTLVSNYFQDTNRLGVFSGDIKSYVRNGELGINRLIEYLNSWSENITRINHRIISYENMHSDISANVIEIFDLLNIYCDEATLKQAIDLSSFDNMKKIEIKTGFPNLDIAKKAGDNNALRAREGKIGGYNQYLDEADIIYIDEQCNKLLTDATRQLFNTHVN